MLIGLGESSPCNYPVITGSIVANANIANEQVVVQPRPIQARKLQQISILIACSAATLRWSGGLRW
jgi:hypothetical protein